MRLKDDEYEKFHTRTVNESRVTTISKNIYKFKDAIRVDSSCRIKGGCNNNIAFQEELFFDISSFPATFELKLWTQEPENENSKGDINFTIILE